MLAEITFALMHYQQQPTLFIGGLQGANHEVPHAEIQHTTKECHGLFPKRLVLEGICTLARHLGIRQIVAVGNATHIYQNWRYQSKKKDKLHADYDQFWLSMGAKPLDSGYFLLPERIARKPIEEIASKKRAEYRRRYQLLDELEQDWRRISAPDNARRAVSPPGRAPARSPVRTFSSAAAAPSPCPIRRPASRPRSPDPASTSGGPLSGSPCAPASAR